jgi:hypothetical protein
MLAFVVHTRGGIAVKNVAAVVLAAFFVAGCGGSSSPPSNLFNLEVSEDVRKQSAKQFVLGDWYQHRFEEGGALPESHQNLTFNADGTYQIFKCRPYGEPSERKYEPGESGTWEVRVDRYSNTGMIFYNIKRSAPGWPNYVIDRDDGFTVRMPNLLRPMKRGHRGDCP